jgi:3-dehydroquinate synthase
MRSITVTASGTYRVLIGGGLLDSLGTLALSLHKACNAAIIADARVDALYGSRAQLALENAGYGVRRFVYAGGEECKTLATLADILSFLARGGITRADLLVALGGGVTGDMTGMASALYMRGVPYIQVPTTLLAAVDASVGGKTAVNLPEGKNLAGVFYQPALVAADCDILRALPAPLFAQGCAEIIKCGVIADEELFEAAGKGLAGDRLEWAVARCVDIKRNLVEKDERDTGDRQLLNFGHTLGHAIEKCSGFSMPHGHAVAMGMVLMARGAHALGLTQSDILPRLTRALDRWGLPSVCPYGAEELYVAALADKKKQGVAFTVVLPERIGACRIAALDARRFRELVASALEGN